MRGSAIVVVGCGNVVAATQSSPSSRALQQAELGGRCGRATLATVRARKAASRTPSCWPSARNSGARPAANLHPRKTSELRNKWRRSATGHSLRATRSIRGGGRSLASRWRTWPLFNSVRLVRLLRRRRLLPRAARWFQSEVGQPREQCVHLRRGSARPAPVRETGARRRMGGRRVCSWRRWRRRRRRRRQFSFARQKRPPLGALCAARAEIWRALGSLRRAIAFVLVLGATDQSAAGGSAALFCSDL